MKDSAFADWHKENNETPVGCRWEWYKNLCHYHVLQKCWPIQLQDLNRRHSISLDHCSVPTKQMKRHRVAHPCKNL